jgi:ketosteroid isomerase-like protein
MADHPNAELVRKGYDAFTAGDIEWMNEHIHENMVWHEPGNNFLSGDYRGREAVLAHFAKQVQHFLPEFDIHDAVANDDHAIVLASVRVRRHDNQDAFEGRYVHTFHIDAEGRALESWIFNEDQAALDRFLQGLG